MEDSEIIKQKDTEIASLRATVEVLSDNALVKGIARGVKDVEAGNTISLKDLDEDLRLKSEHGYNKFLFEYYHDGAWWTFTMPARSEQEAIERIKKMPNAKLLGVVQMEVPVGPLGTLARAACIWRNFWKDRG